MALKAQWEKVTRVQVIDEALGLVVAYVVKQPMGWKVFSQTKVRLESIGRIAVKLAAGLASSFGKTMKIAAKPGF